MMQSTYSQFLVALIFLLGTVLCEYPFLPGPPNEAYIKSITYSGPGCPPQSIVFRSSNDTNSPHYIHLQALTATIKPKQNTVRNWCQLNVEFQYPPNYSFAVAAQQYITEIYLDKDVSAGIFNTYTVRDAAHGSTFSRVWVGQLMGEFDDVDDQPDPEELMWSPCGGGSVKLMVVTTVILNNSLNGNGVGSVGVSTKSPPVPGVKEGIKVVWRQC